MDALNIAYIETACTSNYILWGRVSCFIVLIFNISNLYEGSDSALHILGDHVRGLKVVSCTVARIFISDDCISFTGMGIGSNFLGDSDMQPSSDPFSQVSSLAMWARHLRTEYY